MKKYSSKQGSSLIKTANGFKIKLSKKEWTRLGQQAGWIKKANWNASFHNEQVMQYQNYLDIIKQKLNTLDIPNKDVIENKIMKLNKEFSDLYFLDTSSVTNDEMDLVNNEMDKVVESYNLLENTIIGLDESGDLEDTLRSTWPG